MPRWLGRHALACATMTLREVTVDRLWAETPTLTGVLLEAPEAVRVDHERPGQVVAVQPPEGKRVFLALASAPGDNRLELLVAEPAAERIGLAPGAILAIEGPFGKGYPLELARGRDVLLFAVGSAMAPIKPLIEMIRRERGEYGRVSLYVGAIADDAFAYRGQYEAWMRDRIDVTKVKDPEWVQDAFAADPLPLDQSIAYVCGMDAMMDGVTDTLERFGLARENVHRNW